MCRSTFTDEAISAEAREAGADEAAVSVVTLSIRGAIVSTQDTLVDI